MPWPGSIAVLLALPDSGAARALRWGLRGLRASLQAALEEAGDDPGGPALRELLAELDPLLDAKAAPAGTVLPADEARPSDADLAELPPAVAAGSPRLLALAQAVAADPRLGLGPQPPILRTGSDADLWQDVQRLLLRVPPTLAAEWQRRSLELAAQVGCQADESSATVLPLPFEEMLYPGLAGAVRLPGLRAAPGAPADPRLAAPADDDLRFLAGLVATYLVLMDQDPALGHCLKSVFRFGVTPLRGEQRERYAAELLRLWERVRQGSAGQRGGLSRQELKERLKARLDLDEALHSLVCQPPAAPDSWWGRLQARARETLFRARDQAVQAGCPAHLQTLAGNFADLNRLAPDSLQVDWGVPGEVVVCLRVWARLDGEELKGRVLYRSPQEEA